MKGDKVINGVILHGNYNGMEAILETKKMPKSHNIPKDAYYSSAHIYDIWERENEK